MYNIFKGNIQGEKERGEGNKIRGAEKKPQSSASP